MQLVDQLKRHWSSWRKKVSTTTRRRLFLEPLEDRLPLAVDLPDAYAVFAEGTPVELVLADHEALNIDDLLAVSHSDELEFAEQRWQDTAHRGGGSDDGDPVTLTWSIVGDGTWVPGAKKETASPSNFVEFMSDAYGSNAGPLEGQPWFSMIENAFGYWEDVSGVDFVYEPNDDGAPHVLSPGELGVRGDIRIGGHAVDGNRGILAYTFFPDYGDIVVDTSDIVFTSGSELHVVNTLVHEIGHSLDLPHVFPANGTKIMEPILVTGLMGPQEDDLLAINRLYGDRFEPNDVMTDATVLGELANGAISVEMASIDDDADVDLYQFTVTKSNQASITVIPEGTTYERGVSSKGVSLFRGHAQSDLTVEILDATGQVVLARADQAAIGSKEAITDFSLSSAGDYFIRVSGQQDAAQMYRLEVGVGSRPAGSAEIRGSSWNDLNGNGEIDESEPVIVGQAVFLDQNGNGSLDTLERSTLTDGHGQYAFVGLDPSETYTVSQVSNEHWKQTFPRITSRPATHYPVGSGTRAIEAADFDGDGDIDLAAANRNSRDVTILNNDGLGQFNLSGKFSVGSTPLSMVQGDFDGDKDIDLIVANYGSNSVSVLLNDGAGSFAPAISVQVGDQPRSITSADFDGDGDLDIAVANSGQHDMQLLMNHGDATFSTGHTFATSGGPWRATHSDIDNDGDVDLVVTTGYTGSTSVVSIFKNSGRAMFEEAFNLLGGGASDAFHVADINGDGTQDVISANYFSQDVSLVTNNGSDSFQDAITFSESGSAESVTTADMDDDGDVDVVITYLDPDRVAVFRNLGNGSFGNAVFYETAANPDAIAIADFNGDRLPDIAVGNYSSGNLTVLMNASAQHTVELNKYDFARGLRFAAQSDLTVSANPNSVEAGDIDMDGDLDLVVASYSDISIALLTNDGTGSFSVGELQSVGFGPSSVTLGDLDGDGDLDVVAVTREMNEVSILENDGAGSFGAIVGYAVGDSPISVVVDDVDGDGDLDLMVLNQGSQDISILTNDGVGGFALQSSLSVPNRPTSIAARDLDEDGDVDFVVTNATHASAFAVSVFTNNGDGSFISIDYPVMTWLAQSVGIGDLNGDGFPDLAVPDQVSASVKILINAGDGTFEPPVYAPARETLRNVVMTDVDGDGSLDLAVADSDNILFLINSGDGGFVATEPLRVDGTTPELLIRDFNLDGNADLVFLNATKSTVSIMLNAGDHPVAETVTGINFGNQRIAGTNTPPSATTDAYFGFEDKRLDVDRSVGVLANDSNNDVSGSLAVELGSDVRNGNLTLSDDGGFTYDPSSDFSGIDTFTYRVFDGQAYSDPATVTITVEEVNDSPTLDAIANPSVLPNDGSGQSLQLSGISAGPAEDDQSLDFTAFSDNLSLIPDPTVSYVPGASTATLSYAPVAGEFGTARLTVTVRDDGLDGVADNQDDASVSRSFIVTVVDGLIVEAESGTGDGVVITRDDASGEAVRQLRDGQRVTLGFDIDSPGLYEFSVRTSNEQLGAMEMLELYVSGVPIGMMMVPDSTEFTTTTFTAQVPLKFGPHTAELMLSRGDASGVDVDFLALRKHEELPEILISHSAAPEGLAGTTPMVFQLQLSHASSVPVTVRVNTQGGTATANEDYIPLVDQVVTFPPGTTSQEFEVRIFGDTKEEENETFQVILSEPGNALLAVDRATGTILERPIATYGPTVVAVDPEVLEAMIIMLHIYGTSLGGTIQVGFPAPSSGASGYTSGQVAVQDVTEGEIQIEISVDAFDARAPIEVHTDQGSILIVSDELTESPNNVWRGPDNGFTLVGYEGSLESAQNDDQVIYVTFGGQAIVEDGDNKTLYVESGASIVVEAGSPTVYHEVGASVSGNGTPVLHEVERVQLSLVEPFPIDPEMPEEPPIEEPPIEEPPAEEPPAEEPPVEEPPVEEPPAEEPPIYEPPTLEADPSEQPEELPPSIEIVAPKEETPPESTEVIVLPIAPTDVNGDGHVTSNDVLQIVNALNRQTPGGPPGRLDVNGDGVLSPFDALFVINFLNNRPAEGEAEVWIHDDEPEIARATSDPSCPTTPRSSLNVAPIVVGALPLGTNSLDAVDLEELSKSSETDELDRLIEQLANELAKCDR